MRMCPSSVRLGFFGASLVALAVAPPSAAQRGGSRDSAGVAIASHRERTEPRVAFTLSPLPVMAIGGVSGDANYEFGQNVPAAARFADGRIVVADPNPAPAVRIYSREGRYVRTLGRRGTGAGEYNNPTNVFILRGDTIAVVDNGRADAILLFTSDGKFQRLERTRTSGFVSMLASGEWLTRSGGGPTGDSIRIFRRPRGDSILAAAPAPPTPRPGDTTGGRGAGRRGIPTPETGLLITTLPGRARISMSDSGVGAAQAAPGGRGAQPAGSPSPFVLAPIVAGLPDGFVYGDPARYEIREYAASGALRRIIRRRVDLRLDSAEIARYKAAQLAGREGDALREAERRLASMTFPRTEPAFERILVDGARRLWVKDFEPVPDSPGQWTVFDPTGAMLGTVSTPPKFRVFEVGSDYVLGRWRDAEGVAYIHLFELRERKEH